jgi:glutamate--cysteine ligase
VYLFGASPALSKCFLDDFHHLNTFHNLEILDKETLYMPYATSLRMSDLGYTSKAQASLTPQFDSLNSYIKSLSLAVSKPYPPYAEVGTHRNGEWVQINTNVLQIENEYYSTIRPKRVTQPGEQPIQALSSRGIQYVEVRCIDIDPFAPLGINLETSYFLDAFLLFCALHDSPLISTEEHLENAGNFSLTVKEGRRPGLKLRRKGSSISLQTWGQELIEKMSPLVALLDTHRSDGAHMASLKKQDLKLKLIEKTPSSRVLSTLLERKETFGSFALRQSKKHAEYFQVCPLSTEEINYFNSLAATSISEQETLERTQSGDFDSFVKLYLSGSLNKIKD